MSSLLKVEVTPLLSMTQKQAVAALGGLEVLRDLEANHGLRPWSANATNRRYRVAAIEAALERAEEANTLATRARRGRGESTGQSTAAE